jgi:hypothetical protein
MSKFDWYQATIPDCPKNVTEILKEKLEDCVDTRTQNKGGNGYLTSTTFFNRRGGEIGRMMSGGNQFPNYRSVSHHAPAASRVIRTMWPKHKVTRLDVAIDYTGDGVFDHLHAIANQVAEENKIKTGLMMQPDLLDKGRTYRLGSTTSPVMVRLYEKGLHEISKGYPADSHWTRLELQVRPQKVAKQQFASVTPHEAWGASRWTAKLIKAIEGQEPERIEISPKSKTEWEKTQESLVLQYGRHAISGGFRAAGGNETEISIEKAIDTYLAILRHDLITHVRKKNP